MPLYSPLSLRLPTTIFVLLLLRRLFLLLKFSVLDWQPVFQNHESITTRSMMLTGGTLLVSMYRQNTFHNECRTSSELVQTPTLHRSRRGKCSVLKVQTKHYATVQYYHATQMCLHVHLPMPNVNKSVCKRPRVLALDERADAFMFGVRGCMCGHVRMACPHVEGALDVCTRWWDTYTDKWWWHTDGWQWWHAGRWWW